MPNETDAKRRIALTAVIARTLADVPPPAIANILREAGIGDFNEMSLDELAAAMDRAETPRLELLATALGLDVVLRIAASTDFVSPDLTLRIPLEEEQARLLSILAEAHRNLPSEQRQKFHGVAPISHVDRIEHPGLPNGQIPAYRGDWEILAGAGLIQGTPRSDGQIVRFDVTPLGFAWYREMKALTGRPMDQVATEVTRFVEDDEFSSRYPGAAERWRGAHSDLWTADSETKLTEIGHKCREAMQQFADTLISRLGLEAPDQNLAKDQSRIWTVVTALARTLGDREKAMVLAHGTCWQAVSDLVQRQEHGGQKTSPLVWEDGRRVVFQAAVVMYELHRLAGRYGTPK